MDDFQYNKLLEETTRSKSRFYKMEKKSNNHQENYNLEVKTCRIAKTERQLSIARESKEILRDVK